MRVLCKVKFIAKGPVGIHKTYNRSLKYVSQRIQIELIGVSDCMIILVIELFIIALVTSGMSIENMRKERISWNDLHSQKACRRGMRW